jgi:hypothetical protein
MAPSSYPGSWSDGRKKSEQGQALVYGLFVLIGGLASLFFLFNTGQLTREKTKLVNTSDAVAYSAGVMNARTFNFQAYTNRAMVANTVAIAQLVSLSSWIQYAGNVGTYGLALANPKFVQFYPSYVAAQTSGTYLQESLNDSGALEKLAKASDKIIQDGLMNAQQVAHGGLLAARQNVMNDVAHANYANDGTVVVEQLTLPGSDYTSFTSRYSGSERARFRDVVTTSTNLDSFVPTRSWKMPALYADCLSASPRVDWLDRRGGTELIEFDQWQALDTLSEKRWVPRNKFDVFCTAVAETPAGWGGNIAADNASADFDPRRFDGSFMTNPGSSLLGLVTSQSWDYSGLPSFYDLSGNPLAQEDPRFRFSVRLLRDKSQTVTSEGRSAVGSTPRLNAYVAQPAGGADFVAVSTSEVFFQRDGGNKDNSYGLSIGKPREIGSLFNPYWQVHLVQSDADIKRAQGYQGVVLP